MAITDLLIKSYILITAVAETAACPFVKAIRGNVFRPLLIQVLFVCFVYFVCLLSTTSESLLIRPTGGRSCVGRCYTGENNGVRLTA